MRTTLITTFAIALMVFAFSASSVMAGEDAKNETSENIKNAFDDFGTVVKCAFEGKSPDECPKRVPYVDLDDIHDPDQPDDERGFTDSGNEDSASAASASNQ